MMGQQDVVADGIGIGFGPANIALAVVAEESAASSDLVYIEGGTSPEWQPGMLIADSDIQNSPVRDLVSLRNPRSRYSFTNYLHEEGRLLDFLNLPLEFPLRKDFAKYVKWVGETVDANVNFGARATTVRRRGDLLAVEDEDGNCRLGRSIIVGTGRSLHIPDVAVPMLGEQVFHATRYLDHIDRNLSSVSTPRVLIVGASQSGVELALDVRGRSHEAEVSIVSRGIGPRLKDTSPFTEHAYFPEFTDYYYSLTSAQKRDVDAKLRNSNYSAADADVIEKLYVAIYEDSLDGHARTTLRKFTGVEKMEVVGQRVRVTLREVHTGEVHDELFDTVILATGFQDLGPLDHQERVPRVLAAVADELLYDEDGYLVVSRSYQTSWADGSPSGIFLNGLCETSHGLGDAGSFSLLSLRSETILNGVQDYLSVV